MINKQLFDYDDYQASPALISRAAANILSEGGLFGFLARATLDALRAAAEATGDAPLEAITGRARHTDAAEGRSALIERLACAWEQGKHEPRIAASLRNAGLLAEVLDLSDEEREVLFVRLVCEADRAFCMLLDNLRQRLPSVAATIAAVSGLTPAQARRCLAPDATLRRTGILTILPESEFFTRNLSLLDRFEIFGSDEFETAEAVTETLLGQDLVADLPMAAFDHLPDAQLAAKVLEGAYTSGEVGVNVLLYGPPGTGKTELAKTLAQQVGAALYAVGEADRDGDEPSRFERLNLLKLSQHILSRIWGGMCLFDEAEDIFQSMILPFGPRNASKVYLNRLFENNKVPTIWIANDVSALPITVRRRMTLAIKVDPPPAQRHTAILGNLVKEAALPIPEGALEGLVRDVPVTPGVAAKAVQATRLAGGDARTLETATRGLAQALKDGTPVPASRDGGAPAFDAALANADMDLVALAERLAPATLAYSLCLFGPSGTGKSAFARHLAERAGLPARILRGSDLLGPYVGETERAIREAFDSAARDRQFLILDEVDGLLSARADAHRSFELTRVNELLTAMEAHPMPFAVTTNLVERLDPAARRRIDFHIAFATLGPAQAAACWRHFLDGEPPAALARLSGLTPAHFARVRRRARLLGMAQERDALLRWLEAEARPQAANPVGFRAPLTAA